VIERQGIHTASTLAEPGLRTDRGRSLLAGMSRAFVTIRSGEQHPSLMVRLAHGISWQVALNIVGRIGTFSIAVIQARVLGKAGYGELGMVFSTLTLFGLFSNAVGGQTCTKFIAEMRRSDSARAGRIAALSLTTTLAISFMAALAIILASNVLATGALRAPQLKPLLSLAGISLGLDAVMGTVSGVLLGLQRFRADSVLRLVQIAVWLVLTASWSRLWGVTGAMCAYTAAQVAALAVYSVSALQICRSEGFNLRFSGMWRESRILLEYSLPLSFHACLCVSTVWVGNAILARQPAGFAALGGYVAAVQLRTIVLQIPMLMQNVVWPAMAELYGGREDARLGRLFRTVLVLLWAVGLLAALFMIGLGKAPIAIFGRAFTAEREVMAVVMASASLSLISSFAGITLQVINRTWFALYANAAYSAVALGAALMLVPGYSGLGLAGAFLVGTLVQAMVLLAMVRRFAPNLYHNRHLQIPVLSIALCAAVFFASRDDSAAALALRCLVVAGSVLIVWRVAMPAATRQFLRDYASNF
jgi:O-antigen/teichoic acid export membrane protein